VHALYVLSVWLHILAAVVWVGGMFFLVLVVVPWLRSGGGRANAGAFLRETGIRFRGVGWACFAVVLITGTFNLWVRGVRFGDLVDPGWLGSPFGSAVSLKLLAFLTVLVVSAVHDFVLGPKATIAITADPTSAEALGYRRKASLLGRVNALLGLTLVALAVIIVRGWPAL